ncbi:MAG: hypothetical protein ACM31C_24260 [Acidobacteriota bacterium]
MKLRTLAPALLALAALIAVYVVATRDSEPAASAPVPAAPAVATTPAPAAPAPAMTPPPELPTSHADPTQDQPPTITPHVLSPDEYAGHEARPNKPKMTLDDKLAATRTHLEVMARRAKLLEAEIAELERTGQQDKAAQQRIVLRRLEAHADKLRADVAAGREPE